MATTLNRATYSGLDFDTHGDDLRSRLQVQFAAEFNDFAVAGLGIMLLDLVAYGLDTLSFYLDRRATDTFMVTARTRKSVSRLSRQLGYPMGGAVSSGVDVEVYINTAVPFAVTIPQGFQFRGPNNLIFETARAVTFAPGVSGPSTAISIPCFEGETFVETFTSDGTSAQVFELRRVPSQKNIVQGTVEVLVNGAPWEFKDLLEFGATDQFEVGFSDDPPTVRFGDGISGNIPPSGNSIQVTYVASRGRAGQVAQNTIDDTVSPLVVFFQTIDLVVNNPEPAVGGDDPESISRAKTFAPQVFKSRRVAVVASDYSALAGSYADPLFGRVAVAKAIAARGADDDLELQSLLTDLDTAVDAMVAAVTAATSAITTAISTANTELTAQATTLNDIESAVAQILTDLTQINTAVLAIKNAAGLVTVDATDIQGYVISGKAAIDAIATAGASQLTAGDKTALKAWFDLINGEAVQIGANAAAFTSQSNTALSAVADAQTEADSVGALPGTGLLQQAETQRTSIATQVTAITTQNNTIIAAIVDITAEVAALSQAIFTHVDLILSADCKANLVTVPILVRNAAGFYAGPSTGLIASLQAFLDERKEVTQTVIVTSGEDFLVPVVLVVRVGVRSGFSEQVVKTAVDTAIDGVLRDRDFGENLYVSDMETAVLAVDGVAFTNITISGFQRPCGAATDNTKNDSSGNLIILPSEVITKCTTTINTEAFVVQ
jgi:hypothetical protein